MEHSDRLVRCLAVLAFVGLIAGSVMWWLGARRAIPSGMPMWDAVSAQAIYEKEKGEMERQVSLFEDELRQIHLPPMDFEGMTLGACVAEINRVLVSENLAEPISFEFFAVDDANLTVTSNFPELPLNELLSEMMPGHPFGNAGFFLGLDRRVQFYFPVYWDQPVFEGWFRPTPGLIVASGVGPVDVKKHMETIGVPFPPNGHAIFYPEVGLLWASTTFEEMEVIDLYCAMKPPTLWERLVRWHIHESPWSRWVLPPSSPLSSPIP